MVPGYSRLICVVAIIGLWLPLSGTLMNPTRSLLETENRTAFGFPEKPATLLEWLEFPHDLEAFLNDSFGFRDELVLTYSTLRFVLRSPVKANIAFGENGWIFYAGDKTFEQSRGQVLRHKRLGAFTRLAAEMDALIKARGGRLLVAIPPNKQTLSVENLPSWALSFDGPTEYDTLMKLLAEQEVEVIDLRPVLHAGKTTGPVYRPRDTHWSNLGALLAFNAIAQYLGREDWIIDPAKTYRGDSPAVGDLAGMAGVPHVFLDTQAEVALDELLPAESNIISLEDFSDQPSYVMTTSNGDAPVMIIGDSFTRGYLRDFMATRTSRLVWTHFRWCEFDWKLVEENLPTTVILMPTERYAGCGTGRNPKNFPLAR